MNGHFLRPEFDWIERNNDGLDATFTDSKRPAQLHAPDAPVMGCPAQHQVEVLDRAAAKLSDH